MQALFLIVGIPSVNKGWMKWCLRLNVLYKLWFCLLKFRTRAWMAFLKWKETCMFLCPWLCGVMVGSVGASGCLEGLRAAAGLLLDRGFPLRCHNTVAFIKVPSHAHRQIHTLGKFRFCGKKYKCAFCQFPLTCFHPSKHLSICFFLKLHFSFSFCVLLFSAF